MFSIFLAFPFYIKFLEPIIFNNRNPIFLGFFAAFIYVVFLCFACAPCMLCFTNCCPSTCPPTYFAKLYGTVGVDFATAI